MVQWLFYYHLYQGTVKFIIFAHSKIFALHTVNNPDSIPNA